MRRALFVVVSGLWSWAWGHRILRAHRPRIPRQRSCTWPTGTALQLLVRRQADGIVHVALLERVVDLRLRERGVCAERHARAHRLLPVNLRHEEVVPVVGAMHVAWPQRRGHAVPVLSEQKQRVVANGLEVPVVGTPFLRPMHWALARIHVEHGPAGARRHPGLCEHLPVHGRQPDEILLLGQQIGLEPVQRRRQRRAAVPELWRPVTPNVTYLRAGDRDLTLDVCQPREEG